MIQENVLYSLKIYLEAVLFRLRQGFGGQVFEKIDRRYDENGKFNNWLMRRYFMCDIFPAADNKDCQDEKGGRFIFDNVFYAFFGCIFVVNLWNIDRIIAYNSE